MESIRDRIRASSYAVKAVEVGGITVPDKVKKKALLFITEEEAQPIPESDLDAFDPLPDHVLTYLRGEKRQLHEDIIGGFGLVWHPKAKRIGIPIRDCKGNLVGISGHKAEEFNTWRGPKYLHSNGFQRDLYLFGEHAVVKGHPGFLVEGFYDVIRMYCLGYRNVVACMGSYLSAIHVEKIVRWFPKLTIVPDGDEAGKEASRGFERAIAGRIPVHTVNTPPGMDPGDIPEVLMHRLIGPPAILSLDNPTGTQ